MNPDVTATLLEHTGAEEVSIRDVCQAAGITAPTVYHHFGDKKTLLEHPAFYRLMYGTPNAEERPPAREGHRVLVGILDRLAEAGRLRLPPEQAATVIHTGAVLAGALLATLSVGRAAQLTPGEHGILLGLLRKLT